MSLRSGLASQFGMAKESAYGVVATPTRFLPHVSESIGQEIARIESEAIIAGRQVLDSTQWAPGAITVGGDLGFELYDRGIGLLLEQMFGGAAITGSDPYTQTYTPGDLAGISFTGQVGVPDTSGTVRPKTAAGCKVASWEIAWAEGANATLGLTVMARALYRHRTVTDGVTTTDSTTVTSATGAFSDSDIGSPIAGTGIPAATTIASVESSTSVTLSAAATAAGTGVTFTIGTALAAVSYPSGLVPFRFLGATVTVAGSAQKVKGGKVAGDNALEERRFGGSPLTDEPYGAGSHNEYTGEIEVEFSSLAFVERFVRGTESALVVRFAAGTKTLTLTMNVRYDGAPFNVDGKGLTMQALPFKCVGTTDAAAITAVTVNADSAA